MIRNLKILIAAAMVLGAFGAFTAAGAQAQGKFFCSVEPCTFTLNKDGTTTTAHHVFVVKNKTGESISFTCDSLTGKGTAATSPTGELTAEGLSYNTCKSVLGVATVHMNGCTYKFTATNGGTDQATVTVICPAGKVIEITNPACTITVPAQGPLTGVGYHNSPTPAGKTEVTVTAKVPGITTIAHGECGISIPTPTEHLTSEYTTGNTLVTGENSLGVMANAWWE